VVKGEKGEAQHSKQEVQSLGRREVQQLIIHACSVRGTKVCCTAAIKPSKVANSLSFLLSCRRHLAATYTC
jgi:hypothetical protein